MKKLLYRLFFIALLGVLTLTLMEFGVRLFLPEYNPGRKVRFTRNAEGIPLGEPHSEGRQWKNTGDYDVTVRFNRHGLRDAKDFTESRPSDVLVVGDSFSFGWGVEEEERYSNRIERMAGVPVYNLSVPSAHLRTYGKILEFAAARGVSAGRLIVGVCMENDLGRYVDRPSKMPSYQRSSPISLVLLKAMLTENSALYGALTTLVHGNAALRQWAVRAGLVIDNYDGISRNRYDEEILERSVQVLSGAIEGYEATILIIPSRALWVGENREVEDRVHRSFVAMLEERGLRVVDMRPLFEAAGRPLGNHFARDGHWNREGHRKAAEALQRALAPVNSERKQ